MSGQEDKKFESKDDLKNWLKGRGVDEEDAAAAAEKLFAKGFNKPSTLIGISSDALQRSGLPVPLAQTLSNKLKEQPQPNDEGTSLPSHFTPVLLAMATNNMDGWDRMTMDRTVSDSSHVCKGVVAYYGLASRNHCQILGEQVTHVLNAHIWPDHNKGNLVLVDLKAADCDNPRNILRLHRDIERYFDHKQLTFTQSGSGEEFLLTVLDPRIRDKELDGTSGVTLDSIDGKPLIFPNNNLPWRRLLATHSILAHRHARSNDWLIEDELTAAELTANTMMEYSLDAEAQDRVKRFLTTSI